MTVQLTSGGKTACAAPAKQVEDEVACLEERIDALRRLGGSTGRDVLARVVTEYLNKGSGLVVALRQADEQGDSVALAEAAHSFVGIAGILGAGRLVALLQQIEAEALDGVATSFAARLRQVEKEHVTLFGRLSAMASTRL